MVLVIMDVIKALISTMEEITVLVVDTIMVMGMDIMDMTETSWVSVENGLKWKQKNLVV
jgi:hypothetical protein